ncbi:MAG: two-component regulator propeller domain-containing protein [Bacteroidota bacterium]|nr:two-component regulator propeller domain-containing protein [Bacteroidota bacterium]
MNRLFPLFIITLLLIPRFLTGQVFFPQATIFTVNDGLSKSQVNALFQDSRGFLWIGTENGLNRYDGYEFTTYTHHSLSPKSLSNNTINAICETADGTLWIATNKGLNSLDVSTGDFTCYLNNPRDLNTISDNVVLNVFVDYHKTLWIKTLRSLDRFNPQTKTFHRFIHSIDFFKSISGNIRFPLFEDKTHDFWIGTKDGLNMFDRKKQQFHRYTTNTNNPSSLSHNEIRTVCEDNDGALWAGTSNGLNKFNPAFNNFKRYYPSPLSNSSLGDNRVNALYKDKNGRFWVGTQGGLFIFNKSAEKFEPVLAKNQVALNIPIYSIISDRSGIIWVGSLNGLIKINPHNPKFKQYRLDENTTHSFMSNDVGSIATLTPNTLLAGTLGKGLAILNLKNLSSANFQFNQLGSDENNYINCIFEYHSPLYWLGTNAGVVIFNAITNSCSLLSNELNSTGYEASLQNKVNAIVRDKKGKIWLGTYHGLFQISFEEKKVKTYLNNPANRNTLCNNNIHSLECDSKGNLWIATDNGLDCLDTEKERFRHIDDDPAQRPFLSSSSIYSLKYDPLGILWVGTSTGLNRLNLKNNSIKIITQQDGLSDNLIDAITIDKNHRIWVSTNRGINMINPHTLGIHQFDTNDGLQDHEFNLNSVCSSTSGELYFGGVAGINAISPDSLISNNYAPSVVISSIETISPKGKIKTVNLSDDKITIPYQSNIFTINFAALDFTLPGKNNFSYKFYSDKEEDWIYIGNKHSVTFSNLKPGEYHFKLKGSNNDLVWNNQELSLIISIEAPFWLRPEAYYLYALIFLFSILVFYRYRTYHLRKANKLLKDRDIAAREIERQREQLALKNRNITDSINYAKRIQEALMTSERFFKRILPESFVLHQPKDIVSGDFFWISERDSKIFVAAADCTGHGVPGAFMSIIGIELFRKITVSQGIDKPAQILDILNREFEKIFKDVDSEAIKDGMDIAFCVIDKQSRTLEFSGAINPIYLIRDNKITEIRGSRFSIGLDENPENQTFENKQIELQDDDVIYLFSDGYVDQFGGPEGKKFKYRRFRHLLLTIYQYPMEEQRHLLEDRINRWKGNLEQVDDILVIGLKPTFNKN